jgi:hypothetical protein
MSVQMNSGKIPDTANGLVDLEHELLGFTDADRVTAIVTIKVTKKTHDMESGEDYPVVKLTHIEPIRSPEALEQAKALQQSAYQVRTGETALDLPSVDDETDAVGAIGQALVDDVADDWDAREAAVEGGAA